jgi:hypothetical protein
VFDRSAADAEHFKNLLFRAKPGICRLSHAMARLFGKILSNTCANGYASRASRQATLLEHPCNGK